MSKCSARIFGWVEGEPTSRHWIVCSLTAASLVPRWPASGALTGGVFAEQQIQSAAMGTSEAQLRRLYCNGRGSRHPPVRALASYLVGSSARNVSTIAPPAALPSRGRCVLTPGKRVTGEPVPPPMRQNFACVNDEADSNGPVIGDFGKRETILGYAAVLFR